jgi:hypothetical protein
MKKTTMAGPFGATTTTEYVLWACRLALGVETARALAAHGDEDLQRSEE